MRVIWEGLPLEVEYVYSPRIQGSHDSLGVPLDEDEPESVEITHVFFDGFEVEGLSTVTIQDLEALVLKGLKES